MLDLKSARKAKGEKVNEFSCWRLIILAAEELNKFLMFTHIASVCFALDCVGEVTAPEKGHLLSNIHAALLGGLVRAVASAMAPLRDTSRSSAVRLLEADPQSGWFWLHLTVQQQP